MTPDSVERAFSAEGGVADPSLNDEDSDELALYEEYLINTDPTIGNAFVLSAEGLGDPLPALSWESLGLPNGQVISEVFTNLVDGTWQSISGTLSHQGTTTTWQALEPMPDEEAAVLRVNVTELLMLPQPICNGCNLSEFRYLERTSFISEVLCG